MQVCCIEGMGMYVQGSLTSSARVQRSHVEHVNALHLSKDFETLETGRLFEIGRDRSARSSWGK